MIEKDPHDIVDVIPTDYEDICLDQFFDDLSGQMDAFYNKCEERRFTTKKDKKVAQMDFEVYKAD